MADRARRRFEQLGVRGGKTGSITVVQRSNSDWLASFMTYDLGYFDADTCRLEPIENPFAAKVLPMCPE